MDCTQQVSPNPKQIQHDAVHRPEALRVSDGREPAHLAFALTGLVGVSFARLFSYCRVLCMGRHDRAVGRRVAAELVGNQASWSAPLSLQQLPEEPGGRAPAAAARSRVRRPGTTAGSSRRRR